MRIGIVTTVFAPNAECGGPVTVAGQHARELVRRGHEVTVFTSDLIAFAPRTHLGALECQDDGLTIRYFRSWAPRPRYPAVLARVAAGIRERATRLDVVHIHFAREVIPASTAAATRSLGIPTVLQPHGMLGNVAGIRGSRRSALGAAGARKCLGGARAPGSRAPSAGAPGTGRADPDPAQRHPRRLVARSRRRERPPPQDGVVPGTAAPAQAGTGVHRDGPASA